MRVHHPIKRLKLANIYVNSGLKALASGSCAELHTMYQIQFLRNQPEERPHFDEGMNSMTLVPGSQKRRLVRACAMQTDDELGALE